MKRVNNYWIPTKWLGLLIVSFSIFLTVTGCGGGGGGGGGPTLSPAENVTLLGTVDDGTANSPLAGAFCSFYELETNGFIKHNSTHSRANGDYTLVVPPNVKGMVVCTARDLNNVGLKTIVSTVGIPAGGIMSGEDVTPATTIVAHKIRADNPSDPITLKKQMLIDIETKRDPDLCIIVEAFTEMLIEMLKHNLNVELADNDRDGEGPGSGDSAGAGGDAGDGASESPIPNARCEFVVADDNGKVELGEDRKVVSKSALADLYDDGKIDRPDLVVIKDKINKAFEGREELLKAAFKNRFPEGFGSLYADIADDNGTYFLAIPPNMPGYVRCNPPNQENLALATYLPPLEAGKIEENVDVTPATTIFSTNITSELGGDLRQAKENYLRDIAGLEVKVIKQGGEPSKFELTGRPQDEDVGLVAFAATSLFNIFYKNELNEIEVSYPLVIKDFTKESMVDWAFLNERFGIPAAQALEMAEVVNTSVDEAGVDLNPQDPVIIAEVLQKKELVVILQDAAGNVILDVADVIIKEIDPQITCENNTTSCADYTKKTKGGQATFILLNVPKLNSTNITVEVPAVGVYEKATATIEVIGFNTDTLDVTMNSTIPLPELEHTLYVYKSGTGDGTIELSPPGNDCGANCKQYIAGETVILTATPNEGSTFVIWSGDPDCSDGSLTMNADKICTANFTLDLPPPEYTLTLMKTGTGDGTISSSPAGTPCGTNCSQHIAGETVTLEVIASTGSTFDGWSGDDGCSSGTVTMDANKTCTATFTLDPVIPPEFTLTVYVTGSGNGTVTSEPPGIDCTSECSHDFKAGESVILTAEPENDSRFTDWDGDYELAEIQASVLMTQDRNVTATFSLLCSDAVYTIDPLRADIPSGGGLGSFNVTAPSGCGWSAAVDPSVDWITITSGSASGSGNGQVVYSLSIYTGESKRTATIKVGDSIHTVNQWPTYKLTKNNTYDSDPQTQNGEVVWEGFDGTNFQIYYWNGSIDSTVQNISNNDFNNENPQIHNGQVVWQGGNSPNYQIYYWNGSTVQNISNNKINNRNPQIHNGQVVWAGGTGYFPDDEWEIFYWRNGLITPQNISDNLVEDSSPDIHNGKVVWSSERNYYSNKDRQIRYWEDGEFPMIISNNSEDNYGPQIHNNQVVWSVDTESGSEIYYWSKSIKKYLTINTVDDYGARIDDGKVVWVRGWGNDSEIWFWDGSVYKQLTKNGVRDINPDIHEGRVVWYTEGPSNKGIYYWDGSSAQQIYLASPGEGYIYFDIHSDIVVWEDWPISDPSDSEIFYWEGPSTRPSPVTVPTPPRGLPIQ